VLKRRPSPRPKRPPCPTRALIKLCGVHPSAGAERLRSDPLPGPAASPTPCAGLPPVRDRASRLTRFLAGSARQLLQQRRLLQESSAR
jgi:hypothetical protein